MRKPVVPLCDTDLRIGAEVQLPSQHERHYARDIRLKREALQLEHQADMLVEPLGNSHRALQVGQLSLSIGLDGLDPSFDFTHGIKVVGDCRSVAGSEPCL
jgi:hypothetical protein